MGLERKLKRAHALKELKEVGVWCCGSIMHRKSGYDSDKEYFFFCPFCGKEKWVPKNEIAKRANKKGM